jgi:glycosyltransferase involved in cell wall biosynthesis
LRVLCIDIEGGHGGSSKSLFSTLGYMNRSDCEVEVICQRHSQLVEEYKSLGIRCEVWGKMPKLTALNNWLVNLVSFPLFYFYTFPKTKKSRLELLRRLQAFDLLHANHISLTPLLVWLKKKNPKLKIVTHIRTNPKRSIFSKYEASCCLKVSDDLIFITENELENFQDLVGKKLIGHIIHNTVRNFDVKSPAHPSIANDRRIKIISLSNFSKARGVDRLLDVAKMLPKALRSKVVFLVVGDISERGVLRFLPWKRSFQDQVCASEFRDMFIFTGHLSDPTSALYNSNLLFKLTRENNPWGRDILEALSCGLPVVSIGSYDKFVETGKTGLLQNEYDPEAIAQWLEGVIDDQSKLAQMSENAKLITEKLCSAEISSERVKSVWKNMVTQSK